MVGIDRPTDFIMKTLTIVRATLVASAGACMLFAGCGKKSDDAAAPPETPVTAQTVDQAAAPAAPASASDVAPDAQLATVQTAIKARDYEQAATALIALQQARLNAQQAEAVAQQMRQFQKGLAQALANGDPRAKAAADRLRQSATVR